ncbi:MAG: hypothetical protein VW362_12870, partial [Candidatus Nanopelagicales bacterium]
NETMAGIVRERGQPWFWLISHPDVTLPLSFWNSLEVGVRYMGETDPNYGVLGVAGCRMIGKHRNVYGHLLDRGRECGAALAFPTVVNALDEVIVILRGDREWAMDDTGLATYHLWASDLCYKEMSEGRKNYVLPGLYFEHHSNSSWSIPDDPYFYFNLGVLSERYRKPGTILSTPSGTVFDANNSVGVQIC